MIKGWQFAPVAVLILLIVGFSVGELCSCNTPCIENKCKGTCLNGTDIQEIQCAVCDSRTRLTGDVGIINSIDYSSMRDSNNVSSCSVVIESPVGTVIRLYINDFKTECKWDFLHIHDGSSPFNQTIAVYGGYLIERESPTTTATGGGGAGGGSGGTVLLKQDQEIVSTSNSLSLVFRPDHYVNHDGFSLTYKVDGCRNGCHNRGTCQDGVCNCNTGWQGDSCERETCNCQNGGVCKDNVTCVCLEGFTGHSCQIDTIDNWWSYYKLSGSSPGGRANFGGARVEENYWIFGGYHFDGTPSQLKMARYHIPTDRWFNGTDSGPVYRDGHTLTAYKTDLFMFGGQFNLQITDELWKYDTITSQWHQLDPKTQRMSSMGHCAVLVNSTIYFIGGIDKKGIVIIDVQLYNIETEEWHIISHRDMTRAFYDADSPWHRFADGRIYHGRFGASCVYNSHSDRITVFGGLNTSIILGENPIHWLQSEEETIRESTFTEYDIYLKHWSNFYKADVNTVPMLYLATMQLIDRNLVIFGGRHVSSNYPQCFSTAPYIVNIETGEGKEIESFRNMSETGPVRMGLGSFVFNNSVYFVGGYNGQLHADVTVYHLGRCEERKEEVRCSEAREDWTQCSWNSETQLCTTLPISTCAAVKCYEKCTAGADNFNKRCAACEDEPSCAWDFVYPDTCRDAAIVHVTDPDQVYPCRDVPKPSRIKCAEYKLCEHCKGECYWNKEENRCAVNIGHSHQEVDCDQLHKPCTSHDTCDKCIADTKDPTVASIRSCMWCQLDQLSPDGSRRGQCLDTSVYPALYPYGQCIRWSMNKHDVSLCPERDCSGHGNCTLCQAQPECGWCDDGSGTGSGKCHAGTYHGPLDEPVCPSTSWFYDSCPLCQCNGHSNCTDNVNCDECLGQTTGTRCDRCVNGYYGDAANSGICVPCDCSHLSRPFCNDRSGRCKCDTDGVVGVRCDQCKTSYVGHPEIGDTCYKPLKMDATATITLSTNKINLQVVLNKDVTSDVLMQITCPGTPFTINQTINNLAHPMTISHEGVWKESLKRSRWEWGKNPTILKLYLGFEEDGKKIDIEVRQSANQIDLKQFFIIFFACIVILLLVFLLAWTAKIRYSQYRHQRHQEIQLLERALRPYKSHKLLIKEGTITPVPGRIFEVRPLGIEPLSEEKYGIVSYLLTMPGPKDCNLAIVSGSFLTSMSFGKVISNPNVHFDSRLEVDT